MPIRVISESARAVAPRLEEAQHAGNDGPDGDADAAAGVAAAGRLAVGAQRVEHRRRDLEHVETHPPHRRRVLGAAASVALWGEKASNHVGIADLPPRGRGGPPPPPPPPPTIIGLLKEPLTIPRD